MSESLVVVRAQDLGNVALKFIGLSFLYFGFMSLPDSFTIASLGESSELSALGRAVSGIISIVSGVCLTKWSLKLSQKLFGSSASSDIPLPIARELQTVIFRSIGVYVIANGMTFLAPVLGELVMGDFTFDVFMLPTGVSYFGFGVLLLLYRSPWAASLWKRIRLRRTHTSETP